MRSPTRQLKRVIRSTSKRRRALPGGLPYQIRHQLKSRPSSSQPPEKPHITFLGVAHTTRTGDYGSYPNRPHLEGRPNQNLSELNPYLNSLKANNIHRIGVEFRKTQISNEERNSPFARYWHALFLRLKRKGFRPIEIEDPTANKLRGIVSRLRNTRSKLPNSNMEKNLQLFSRYFPTVSFRAGSSQARELETAFDYFRSLKMHERAKKLKVGAAIVGEFHREDIADKIMGGFEVNNESLKLGPERVEQNKTFFERYKKGILKLYQNVQKRKVRLHNPRTLPR